MPDSRRKRLGLIVNPIAGMGGAVGLKGTDGAATLEEARRRGAEPAAGRRAERALERIARDAPGIETMVFAAEMGEDAALACGLRPAVIGSAKRGATSAADTRRAAAAMRGEVDLILFAGGDGTARDVFDAVGASTPILGVPTGVKMHSAVFATTPGNAGNLAAMFVGGAAGGVYLRAAEIMDTDEDAARDDRVSARLYGYASAPYERMLLQSAKAGSAADEDGALDALCRDLVAEMEDGRLYIVGPGTTTRRLTALLGLDGTLLGVDAILDQKLAGKDLGDQELLRLVEGRRATIIVGVVGGQGFLFGRGNQQISAAVIRWVGRDNIMVLSSARKLLALPQGRLQVDTGDAATDRLLSGYMRVLTGPGQTLLSKVSA